MNLLDEGLSSLAKVLDADNPMAARLVKAGRFILLEINPGVGRRMGLYRYNLVLLGEIKDGMTKVKVSDGSLKNASITEKDLARLEKIEKTLREMQAEKTKVSFVVE